MGRKVIIASDSTCDLSKELIEQYDVKILPLHINFGDESYNDGVDIHLSELYEMVEQTKELPKTSAVSPREMHRFFRQFVDEGYDVFYTGIGSNLSVTYNVARLEAEEFDGHVFVSDSGNLSTGIGLLVLKACTFRDQGLTASEIKEKIDDLVPRVKSQFVVETLNYLHKGGRCSGTSLVLSKILSIKPMIVVRNGKMTVGKKFIGSMKKAVSGMVKMFLEDSKNYDNEFVFITHTLAHEKATMIKEMIKDVEIKNLYDTVAGCVIGSHCGPGTIGILYIMNEKVVA